MAGFDPFRTLRFLRQPELRGLTSISIAVIEGCSESLAEASG